MDHQHLTAAALQRLLATDRTAEQTDLLFHLLSVCPSCRTEGGWLLELRQAEALPSVFGLIDAALARSRAEAPRLLEDLLRLAPQDRLSRLQSDPRLVSWGLCELIAHQSRQNASEAAAEAHHLAALAIQIADRLLGCEPFEEPWIHQLRSLAWASLGNAQRVQGNLARAEESFAQAASLWTQGTTDIGDALGYEPIILDLAASLSMAQRRLPEALTQLELAIGLFLQDPEHRDLHLAGRSLILKAFVLIEQGESESAIQALTEAEALIDPNRDPRLLLCVRHNLVDNLSKMGRHTEAAGHLPELRELAATHGSTLDHLRLQWVEGRIAAGQGNHEQARRQLAEVRQTFLATGNVYEAALATLDLVIPDLKEGKTAEVRELADEMVAVFRDHEVPREALAGLLLFQEAARQETATADLAREVAESLARARPTPIDPGQKIPAGLQHR